MNRATQRSTTSKVVAQPPLRRPVLILPNLDQNIGQKSHSAPLQPPPPHFPAFPPTSSSPPLSLLPTKTRPRARPASMGKGKASVAEQQLEGDFVVPPSSGPATLDSSDWPLLLKNFHRLNVRSSHFTPLPSGALGR